MSVVFWFYDRYNYSCLIISTECIGYEFIIKFNLNRQTWEIIRTWIWSELVLYLICCTCYFYDFAVTISLYPTGALWWSPSCSFHFVPFYILFWSVFPLWSLSLGYILVISARILVPFITFWVIFFFAIIFEFIQRYT